MKGHLRERSPGHWAIVLDVPDPASGKRRRRWYSFNGTKREAQEADLIAAASQRRRRLQRQVNARQREEDESS